jgi:hypothetical protein
MKSTLGKLSLAAALLLSTLNPQLSTFAQGSLTPPGAPAPTMKSLDQVYAKLDSRTAITNAASGYTISVPGSYYLTTNLTVSSGSGITIVTNGVTLDLNGFTISFTSGGAPGYGILLDVILRDITILNGHILGGVTNNGGGVFSGPGFHAGVYGSASINVRVSGVSVSGCSDYGIYLGHGTGVSTAVDSCVMRTIGSYGIIASTITRSLAEDCGATAIEGDQVSDCRGESVVFGSGVFAVVAQNCFGSANSGEGINAKTAANCSGYSNSSQGIKAETASNCYGESVSNRGVFVNLANSCSGRCGGISYGLFATSVANTCYGFSQSGTGLNAYIAIGCVGANGGGSSIGYTYHYNMPP